MFRYFAFGLTIASDLNLPELTEDTGLAPADIRIRVGRFDRPAGSCHQKGLSFFVGDREAYLEWPCEAAVFVRGGREIVVDPAPRVEERVCRLIVLGQAMALLLEQRGRTVLHASAVAAPEGGGAAAFLGASGAGKSTLAAAMRARGWRVLTDNVLALEVENGLPTVVAAFPQLKLWPDSAGALGVAFRDLPRIDPTTEKRSLNVAESFSCGRFPLRRLYFLKKGPGVRIDPLTPKRALINLVAFSYGAHQFRSNGALQHRFLQWAQLANSSPARQLVRGRRLSSLADLAARIEEESLQGADREQDRASSAVGVCAAR